MSARIIPVYVPPAGHVAFPHAARTQRAVAVPRCQAHRCARGLPPGPCDRRSHAVYWHFVDAERSLASDELATLVRLLTYGPHDSDIVERGELLVVVPRPGTVSPWSSKATDIVRNCGLSAVTRVERGIGFRVATRGGMPLADADRAALLPLVHDRMTEAVLARLGDAQTLFAHFPPRSLTTIPLLARGRGAIEAANAALGLALAPDEIDYLDHAFAGWAAIRRTPS